VHIILHSETLSQMEEQSLLVLLINILKLILWVNKSMELLND